MIRILSKEALPFFRPYKMKNLLEDEKFTIPSYQRPFSWGTNEVEDLLEDIINVDRGNEGLHFFGTIITIPTSQQNQDKWSLIDGQQRITTGILFLAVVRNFAESLMTRTMTPTAKKLNYITSEINLMLFGSNDAERKTEFLILQLNNFHNEEQKTYKEFFDGLIINDKYHPVAKYLRKNYRPVKLLNNAYHVIISRIQSVLDQKKTKGAKANVLFRLLQAFISRFFVVVMKANSRPDAMTIYTTINTRGKNLSVPDLIKASLAIVIGQTGLSVQRYMRLWTIALSFFKKTQTVSKFIKLYWIASSGQDNSVRSLPRYVTQEIDTAPKAVRMIYNLAALSPIYKELLNPKVKYLHKFGTLDHRIYILKSMGLTHYYPLMLTLSHNQNSLNDISKVLSVVTKLEMRTALKNGSYPSYVAISHRFWNHRNDVNELIDELNQSLSHYSNSSTYQLVQDYQCRIPKTITSQRYRKISYILACIYARYNGDFSAPNSIYERVFKKHHYILIHVDHEDQDCINNLGNCTLIEKNLGKQIVKQDPQRLIAVLQRSNLISNHKLAQEITESGSLRRVILQRQNQMALDFVHIW